MTHQQNKQFNTYKEGLDFKVLRLAKRLRRLPAGVLYGARGATHDRVRRNAWETGELTRMIDLPYFPNICCPIRITVTKQRKDSEILDAGEREHEEMIGTQLSIIR